MQAQPVDDAGVHGHRVLERLYGWLWSDHWYRRMVFVATGAVWFAINFALRADREQLSVAPLTAGIVLVAGWLMTVVIEELDLRKVRGLERADRRQVVFAVRNGREVAHDRLATAVPGYVARVRHQLRHDPETVRRFAIGFVALACFGAVSRFTDGFGEALSSVLTLAFFVFLAFAWMPFVRQRTLANAAKAEAAALQRRDALRAEGHEP